MTARVTDEQLAELLRLHEASIGIVRTPENNDALARDCNMLHVLMTLHDISMAAELIERRGAERWRPISEAPKDGVAFLAISGMWRTVCCWNKPRHEWCVVSPRYDPYPDDEQPTHWQPLPPPPAADDRHE